MTRAEKEQVEREQEKLAQMVGEDERLAVVAINSFITAFELLRNAA